MHPATRILTLAIGTTICLISGRLSAVDPVASRPDTPTKAELLYLLTYDHGGLVLWGHGHFAERLSHAVAWLEKYPSFKIGLDNEAYTYDAREETRAAI